MSGLLCLAVAAALGGSPQLIRPNDGIGCVDLAMSPALVRATLGRPTQIRHVYSGPGPDLDDWIYVRRRLTLQFILAGREPSVYQIATRNPLYHTRNGVHVGSPERQVRTVARYCRNDAYARRRRYCSNTNEGGVGGTFWLIRHGRAVSVAVAAPVF